MDQENKGHKKLITLIVILLLLLVGIGFFIAWLKPSQTAPDRTTPDSTFSPFDRPTDRAVDVRGNETPYTYVPPAPEPEPVVPRPVVRPEPAPAPAPESTFFVQDTRTQSFNIPSSQPVKTSEPVTYSEPVDTGYAPVYTTYYQPVYVPQPPSTTTDTGGGRAPGKTFKDIDKEVFGYISGLGWTQLLGDTGQQVYDILYGLSPNGTTGSTLGNFLPGAGGGGGGGGGFGGGGGGGGATQTFGGKVTRVTRCTCGNSSMLDINDVRGQTISLIYQPGASRLYSEFNVNGTGQNVLGNYSSGGTCLVYHGEECSSQGSPKGTITQIGTSKQ